MKCPTCGGDAELLKQPCCETAWADHVVSHPSDAVAAAVSSAEQRTISTEGRLALGWRGRLRAALLGYLDIEIAVQTERLAGRSSWRWRVVD